MSQQPRDLVVLGKARRMLAEAKTIGDLKDVRDVGQAAIKWAKSRRDVGHEAVNDAMEIVLESERRLGVMLAENVRQGQNGRESNTALLSSFGISKIQSHRWQAEASVSEEDFQLWKSETRESGKQLTSGALIKQGKQHRKIWAESLEPLEGVCDSLQTLIDEGKRFQCIYADPPWAYSNQETRASTDNHYHTMTVEQIAAEPVEQLAADSCHLHLWTTNGFLFDAKTIMEAWGFEYRSCFIWVKSQMGIGNYWRLSHEFLLLGIRGKATNFLANDERSWMESGRTGHSRKPSAVRDKIQRVSPGPYLEMYGRERTPGWTVYGDQVPGEMQNRLQME
jgi:N6-adenosine-specific RNA methylase IME4